MPSDKERFPELFVGGTIDRRKCERVVPMKVLVLGFMRTGSQYMQHANLMVPSAMRQALKRLGYVDTYHMDSVFENPPDCDMWKEAFAAKFYGKGKKFERKDWDQLLGHCQAVCDLPTAAFIPELFEAYPDSKVIIVQRPVDEWYESCKKTVQRTETSSAPFVLQYLDPYFLGRFIPTMDLLITGLFGPLGQPPKQKQESWCNAYLEIYKEAREVIPKDRILEFELGQGWEPLCKFLGDDIPATPFPHINETASFQAKMSVMQKRVLLRVMRSFGTGLLAVAGIALAYYTIYG